MEYIKSILSSLTFRRFFILFLICGLLISLKSMLNLMLLTFLITYIMNSLQSYVTKKLNRFIKINYRVVVITIYLLLIISFVTGISNLLPKIVDQVKAVSNELINLYNSPEDNSLPDSINSALDSLDLQSYAQQGLGYLLKLGDWGKTFFLSLLLSLFFLLEKDRIVRFTSKFKGSKIAWFYNEVEYFGKKFVVSFGKVIEAQILIAISNTILTTIGLWALGFPYLFALSITIFVLSLIPVVGVIISMIPLSLIGLQIGGVIMIVYVGIMIIVIHLIESYFLNPRFMSSKTKLPMFYSFVILIFSEHYLGIWGLIIGVPIFVFLLDILDVNKADEL
ncbi:AI-2E family transporter [Paenibacillus sp. SYP-B3998]|uniref:AI-2E family transporter n=2 Tax=Paenibacillus sp. SYP-B3998 TaxID=2678564 RepID=A0A6G3ZZN5_9BACL|nr:AI-2E family transporter [Paenibacillus sp. SYP-B3998]NEW07686.1 AI-2E family transporter [Paenibacillus sp. SYP-B3998]